MSEVRKMTEEEIKNIDIDNNYNIDFDIEVEEIKNNTSLWEKIKNMFKGE